LAGISQSLIVLSNNPAAKVCVSGRKARLRAQVFVSIKSIGDNCRKIEKTLKGIEKHEKHCIHNPNGKHCYMCKHCYEGEYRDVYGYLRVVQMCCSETVLGRMKEDCPRFERDTKPYHHKIMNDNDEIVLKD
jgi:hypothetical protein